MKRNKKIFALTLAFILTIIGTAGVTMAYLTDTDEAENTFAVGNVQIKLIEQQRELNSEKKPTADGKLVDFVDNKVLLPIVGSAQGEKDSNGLPTAANYVDKLVTVENTGASNAYIRVFVAIPHNLDDGADTYNAAANVLHFNLGNKQNEAGKWVTTNKTDWSWGTTDAGTDWNAYETTIAVDLPNDGKAEMVNVDYTVYVGTYLHVVESGDITTRAIDGLYLDEAVDCTVTKISETTNKYEWTKGKAAVVYPLENGVVIPVFAQAVQADGFADAFTAFDAAKLTNPWK